MAAEKGRAMGNGVGCPTEWAEEMEARFIFLNVLYFPQFSSISSSTWSFSTCPCTGVSAAHPRGGFDRVQGWLCPLGNEHVFFYFRWFCPLGDKHGSRRWLCPWPSPTPTLRGGHQPRHWPAGLGNFSFVLPLQKRNGAGRSSRGLFCKTAKRAFQPYISRCL